MPGSVSDQRPAFLRYRYALIALWVVLTAVAVYLFFFHREATQTELRDVMSTSLWVAGLVYLVLTILRGVVFMPAAPLVLVGIAFFPPLPLFLLTVIGNVIPAAAIYLFPEKLRLKEAFGEGHNKMIAQIHMLLNRGEFLVITIWSFLPFTPTDLIVYVCGLARIDFKKTMLAVALGSGANCAIYIFLGDYILRITGLKV